MACEECRRLRAELLVRTSRYKLSTVPDQHCSSGRHSAYRDGYDAGWRNQQYRNPYTRRDCYTAYYAGYRAGEADSLEEIGTVLQTS